MYLKGINDTEELPTVFAVVPVIIDEKTPKVPIENMLFDIS